MISFSEIQRIGRQIYRDMDKEQPIDKTTVCSYPMVAEYFYLQSPEAKAIIEEVERLISKKLSEV